MKNYIYPLVLIRGSQPVDLELKFKSTLNNNVDAQINAFSEEIVHFIMNYVYYRTIQFRARARRDIQQSVCRYLFWIKL